MNDGKVTVAVLKTDIAYLKESHEELKADIKEVKEIILSGSSKIAELRGSLTSLKWVYGSLLGLLGLVVTVVAALK